MIIHCQESPPLEIINDILILADATYAPPAPPHLTDEQNEWFLDVPCEAFSRTKHIDDSGLQSL